MINRPAEGPTAYQDRTRSTESVRQQLAGICFRSENVKSAFTVLSVHNIILIVTQCQLIYSKNTNYLNTWSCALLEKLPVTQQLKNFPTFYETQTLNSMLTSPQPVPILSQINSVHFTPSLSL
jgi:hypothetical protein